MSQKAFQSHWFARLAMITALLTLGLIVFGAVVRVTDSGLGCGNHWPLCNGTIFPPLDNITAWIEWLHRLFALLIGIFGLLTLYVAVRAYRQRDRYVLGITVAGALLFVVQSALGALVVIFDLPPTTVTLHLGTAMLLLGAMLVAVVLSSYKDTIRHSADRVTALAYITTALSLVIILTGALVRGSGSTLACTDWPLCNGSIFPAGQGQWALIHMFHRYAVLAFGVSLLLLVYFVYRDRQDPRVRTLAMASLIAYLAQAAIGAFYVLTRGAALWGAAHVGFAATTWALLVVLSAIEWLNSRELNSSLNENQWKAQSKTLS